MDDFKEGRYEVFLKAYKLATKRQIDWFKAVHYYH
jgi:hypothetical protein